jgi:hypothetical protein
MISGLKSGRSQPRVMAVLSRILAHTQENTCESNGLQCMLAEL